jgi:hypothetical protein
MLPKAKRAESVESVIPTVEGFRAVDKDEITDRINELLVNKIILVDTIINALSLSLNWQRLGFSQVELCSKNFTMIIF